MTNTNKIVRIQTKNTTAAACWTAAAAAVVDVSSPPSARACSEISRETFRFSSLIFLFIALRSHQLTMKSVEFQWLEVHKGPADLKVFDHVPVVLEGKHLYIQHDGYKSRIKLKDVDEIDSSQSGSLVLKVRTTVFTFGNAIMGKDGFADFSRRLRSTHERSRSASVQQFESFLESSSVSPRMNPRGRTQAHRSKQRGTFGKSFLSPTRFSTSQRVPKPRYQELFSEDEEAETKSRSTNVVDGSVSRKPKTRVERNDENTPDEIPPPEELDELDAVNFRRAASAKNSTKRLDDDSESSDKELFESPEVTTPAAQRLVSPSTLKPHGTDEAEPEADTSQRTITSFFLPKSDAGSRGKAIETTSTTVMKSPLTPTRRPTQSGSGSKSKPSIKSSIQQSPTWLHSSPTRFDPLLKRRELLLGVRPSITPIKNPVELLEQDLTQSSNPIAGGRTLKRMRLTPHRLSNGTGTLWKPDSYPDTPLLGHGGSIDPTPPCRFRGIRNLGNTCYCAASLQMIASAFDFINSLQGRGGQLTQKVFKVAKELLDDHASTAFKWPVDLREVKEAVDSKTDKFAGYEQRDAHEFLGDLVDYIHEELQEERKQIGDQQAPDSSLPTDDFRMTIQKVLKCESCGYSRTMDEVYRYLSVDIVNGATTSGDFSQQQPSVEHGLRHFFQSEVRELKCEKCSDGTHASETLSVSARPRFLLLHLKRFIWVEKKSSIAVSGEENRAPNGAPSVEYVFQKNQAAISIPESLSLNPFCKTTDADSNASSRYKLISLVHHIGLRPSSGHYTADAVRMCSEAPKIERGTETAKLELSEKQSEVEELSISVDKRSEATTDATTHSASPRWVSFDDAASLFNDLERLLQSKGRQSSAYMLLYALDNGETK